MEPPSELRKKLVFCQRSEALRLLAGVDDLGVPIVRDLTEEELQQLKEEDEQEGGSNEN